MHRALLTRSALNTVSAVRSIPRATPKDVFRRNTASLAVNDDYLPNLLAEDGLVKFLNPSKEAYAAADTCIDSATRPWIAKSMIRFSIDRNTVRIKCHVSVTAQ